MGGNCSVIGIFILYGSFVVGLYFWKGGENKVNRGWVLEGNGVIKVNISKNFKYI